MMKQQKEGSRTVSVETAGTQLGLSRNSAYEAARRGEIPTIRIGKRLLVPIAALDALLNVQPTANQGSR
jgi:excisionase family DNA binding protein